MTDTKNFHFINNEFIPGSSKDSYAVYNPATESHISDINLAREPEVNAAVTAARAAYETGPWSTQTAAQRSALLHKFADLLLEPKNVEAITAAEVAAMGQPTTITSTMLLPAAAATWRYYAGWTDKITGETFDAEGGWWKMTKYESLGVCAGIGPWNVTLMTMAWKLAPALAAGNTVIWKASEKSPYSSLVVARLFEEAGFPPGVVNVLTGDGITGHLLASHMDIDKISFTGSGLAGRKVTEAAAKSNLKKVTLELGGKSPSLVFEDADLGTAVAGNSQGFLFNSSQACIAASRLYVQKSIAPQFIAALKSAFEGAVGLIGDPSSPSTMLGPLADQKQFERVMSFISSAKDDRSAELLVGGDRVGEKGTFVQPTIFLNPGKESKIVKEEVFGPVLVVNTFETEEEAVKVANDTSYGLSATVYTSNTARALRVASKVKAGTVSINGPFMPDHNMPFGGYKESGSGRELGKEGLMSYLQVKTIKINMAV